MEQLTGVGDIFDRHGLRVARRRYRLHVVQPGDGPQKRVGYVALAIEFVGGDAPLLGSSRLTLRCDDGREVDFFVLPTADASGGQVLTLGAARHPPTKAADPAPAPRPAKAARRRITSKRAEQLAAVRPVRLQHPARQHDEHR